MDWDGYTGVIPRTSATLAKVLGAYGYKTAAFGKWHNTPATETTAMGPFTLWPTGEGIGFDYFYGFLAGETSQWEPRLVENLNPIEPPHDEKYHLSEDLADKAITWMRKHRAFSPDKPFFMYWAPGAGHGPHHVFKEWADKYKGKFDDGWDALRERTFERQKELGWIPPDTQLTPRAESMAAWDSIPESERPFQRRLMEVFAGFVEHVDVASRQGDRRARPPRHPRQYDRDLHLRRQRLERRRPERQHQRTAGAEPDPQHGPAAARRLWTSSAVLDALGGPKVDNMYHAGLGLGRRHAVPLYEAVASHFGGTRNPLAISWPARIKPDKTPRSQFHHVNDIAPTIYEILGIKPPKVVDGFAQDPIDGISMVYTFADAAAPARKRTQYFDNNGSRGIYHDGWYACTFGPLTPWLTVSPGLATWDSSKDVWELYDLADRLFAGRRPRREGARRGSRRLKALFLEGSEGEQGLPDRRRNLAAHSSRGSRQDALHELAVRRDDDAHAGVHGAGPRPREQPRHRRCRARQERSGVLYALGGASGGLTLYMDKGRLVYEYNMMIIERYTARSKDKLAPGKHRIEVDTTIAKPGAPAEVVLDGRRQGSRPHDRRSARCRPRSPPAKPSMSASISARRCHSTISTGGRSASTDRSTSFRWSRGDWLVGGSRDAIEKSSRSGVHRHVLARARRLRQRGVGRGVSRTSASACSACRSPSG